MKCIIAGGTGLIGQSLVQHWQGSSHHISILSRSKKKVQKLFSNAVTAISWEDFENNPSEYLSGTDVLINLCGENPGTQRWTAHRRQQLLDSRLIPTTVLANACASQGSAAPHFISASGVSVYGLQTGNPDSLPPAYTEETPLETFHAGFSTALARRWEAATMPAKQKGVNVTITRFGIVLCKHGGALPKMALPFYFGLGGPIGNGNQPMSWVSQTDLCRAIDWIIAHPQHADFVNVVAIQAVRQIEFAHTLGRVLHRPSMLKCPAFAVKMLFGDMGNEFLLHGQHVVPSWLLNNGFEFEHPDLERCLQAIYG